MKSEKALPKKTYHTPNLTVYGDIREITQTTAGTGIFDNNSKTAKT